MTFCLELAGKGKAVAANAASAAPWMQNMAQLNQQISLLSV